VGPLTAKKIPRGWMVTRRTFYKGPGPHAAGVPPGLHWGAVGLPGHHERRPRRSWTDFCLARSVNESVVESKCAPSWSDVLHRHFAYLGSRPSPLSPPSWRRGKLAPFALAELDAAHFTSGICQAGHKESPPSPPGALRFILMAICVCAVARYADRTAEDATAEAGYTVDLSQIL